MLEVFIISFDENCATWYKDEEADLIFINQQKEYLRNVLKSRGWLTVADVILAFGAPIDKNIKYYQYGWDVEDILEFEVVSCGNSSFVITLLGTKKIM